MAALAALLVGLASAPAAGQWIDQPSKGIPRTADGKPDLSAPLPRTAGGKPDLSGIWLAAPDPQAEIGGIEGIRAPRHMIDLTTGMKPEDVQLLPWAETIYRQRNANLRRDNPMIRCLPGGVPRMNAYTHPYKIVQTPELIVFLYESMTMFRQVFVDGRQHPRDPEPSWLGYSIGRWDGDVLVVETIGFNDKTWLDGAGHPHSEEMRLTERFKRRDFGHMEVEVVIDDPKAYGKPLRYTQPQNLLADTELIEYVCSENAKEVGPPK
jgi:hypothetical protein